MQYIENSMLVCWSEQSAVGNLDERDREIPLVAAQNRGQQSAGGPILSQRTLRQNPNSRGDNIRLNESLNASCIGVDRGDYCAYVDMSAVSHLYQQLFVQVGMLLC
ncbi:uncharacterized protein ACHE_10764S [Aspergillus chevalieri]|uniref:Uncharacterized protein n=1 Tax=Aspergillus chevalieri TaxID=182096 RepID=A0A7R7VFJ6_ASPCH|nr:uncharacterized protein ACHE_10764S [Aspergillus chevalieri]BCR83362.1 hypothetical protein ACHE_10764S [Aspergillus chevalieri]